MREIGKRENKRVYENKYSRVIGNILEFFVIVKFNYGIWFFKNVLDF